MPDVELGTRRLPGTDLHIAPVVLGTMTFGGQLDERDSEQVVRHALDSGLVTMLDTAPTYTGGASEEILGRLLPRLHGDIQIATKVGSRRDTGPGAHGRLRPDLIRSTCDESLRRLGVERIDLYYFHMPDHDTPLEESMGALQELVEAGKVGAFGLSNHPAWMLVEAHRIAERNGWTAPRVNQPLYNLLARRLEDTFLRCTDALGMSNLVFNPVAGGLLTGKYRQDLGPTEGTRFALNPVYTARYWNDAQFAAVERLGAIAAGAGTDLLGLSFRWLLSRAGVDGVILGVSSLEQLRTNLAAVRGPVPDDDVLLAVDEVWTTLAGAAPLHYWND